MSHWTTSYVGLPYALLGRDRRGADCWGLAVLIYAEQLEIALPHYADGLTSPEEHAELAALINDVASVGPWKPAAYPRAFDIAVFRRGREETHVGIVVSPGLMLHTSADDHSRLEHYGTGRWGNRLAGIYRHVKAASRGLE
ncbi:MAG: phage tail protein [Rhizobium sp.]|nr:MAG: phage tail protein [Rhizobium sp.]